MKKGKRGQASIVAIVLLLVLVMVLIIIGVVVLIVNPGILGLATTQTPAEQQQPQIIIKTIQEAPAQPLCTYPYTQVGNTCCLDKNYNGICDSDEVQKQNIEYCSRPYIRDGTTCCLDDNDNRVCDLYEYHHNSYSHNIVHSSYLNSPFDLSDIDIKSSEIWMRVSNIGNYDYIIKSIDIEGCDMYSPDKMISEGDDQTFTISCSSNIKDRDVSIEYKRDNDITRTSGGRIRND